MDSGLMFAIGLDCAAARSAAASNVFDAAAHAYCAAVAVSGLTHSWSKCFLLGLFEGYLKISV